MKHILTITEKISLDSIVRFFLVLTTVFATTANTACAADACAELFQKNEFYGRYINLNRDDRFISSPGGSN